MAIQDQDGVTRLQGGLSQGNGVSSSPGVHSVTYIQPQDQFSSGNSNALKVRKAYTISKQREKWTDEEHKKFLEALKLYGRAWPRIEEHVGTKTAVQIRSHAQKFFSKVTRDSSGSNTSLVESIEIPPPRPKRKPMHPYPRKLVETRKKRVSNTEQPLRPCSLKSSHFDQEDISPKSVLSADVSEALGSSDSDTPTQSLSPLSSINGVHTSGFSHVEPKTSFEEHGSPPPAGLNTGLAHDEQPLEKLELLHDESVSTKEVAAEESSGYTLKLFGTTLFVTDTSRPSSPSVEACKPIPAPYYTQLQSENSDISESLSPIVPWWSISLDRPSMPLHKEHEGKHIDSNLMDFEDKEVQKEGSSTGSNSNNSSVHDGENNESSGDQAKSHVTHVHCFNKVDELLNLLGRTNAQSEISAISKLRVRPNTSRKGFVPYKRCMAERENHNLLVTGEEMEMQQIRLSL
ncbi:hypothetical protein TanjilG_18837 [Lupinus angustifolius]|uniref:Uncharacterized protein n=1 Tax=Lupinus angustifolius TaxID=3871 RepID=A0A4P1RQN5_LUPAN|nr:PREDICTED: protein REVEILLE 1-like [Lupinus angustifolius]XP_019432606.1 PREDICTED: protein REVEILLE 1-like [Lupinus angustifolius]OIW16122.1 hypothetical protein TanjilG_18837 [Lupinus angustifolius]